MEGRGGVGRYIWAGITMRQIYSSILAFLHKMWRFCTQSKSWKVCVCIVLPVPVLSVNIPHPTKMMKSLHVHCFAGAYLRTGLMIWRRCFRQDEPQPFWRKNTWRFTKICWRFLLQLTTVPAPRGPWPQTPSLPLLPWATSGAGLLR